MMIDLVENIRKQRYIDKDYKQISNIEELITKFKVMDGELNITKCSNIFKEFDLDINKFYYLDNEIALLLDCYLIYVDNFIYNIQYIIRNDDEISDIFNLLEKKNTYYDIVEDFNLLPSTLKGEAILQFCDDIHDIEKRKGCITSALQSMDNDHYKIKGFVDKYFKKGTYSSDFFIKQGIEVIDDKITIYRGVNFKSIPLEESNSWTTSIDVASKFANRFNSEGKLYIGEINVSDILIFITGRGESEVIVNYNDILNVQLLS